MNKAVIALWNLCVGSTHPLTERLFAQNVLASPFAACEQNLVAVENGQVVGWLLCRVLKDGPPELSRYEGRGSVGALCVHPAHRQRGIGTMLYARGEAFCLEGRATSFSVTHYPYHLVPGVPSEAATLKAFMTNRGFGDWHDAYDLSRSLTDPALAKQLEQHARQLPDGVVIRPARHEDNEALVAFVAYEFPGGWHYDLKRFLHAGGAPSDLVLALEGNTIIGFAHTFTPKSIELRGSTHWFPLLGNAWGGLGPIGIAATHRGRGLGLALLAAGLQHLRTQGVEQAVIDWTERVEFYGRFGFRIWRRYAQGRKNLH